MAKEFKMITIYAMLVSTIGTGIEPTIIGYSEKDSETKEIMQEYSDVYGNDIFFTTKETPHIVFVALRNQAFRNLFAALYAPIDNLCKSLQTLKK